MWNRLEKILMDQTVYLTVKCSIYISAVGLLQGDDVDTVKTNVQTKLPSIVLTAWKFWPLVHLVTYGVIPARHRILWVNCVDLVWNAILATMSQKTEVPKEEALVFETAAQDDNPLPLVPTVVDPSIAASSLLQQSVMDHREFTDSGFEEEVRDHDVPVALVLERRSTDDEVRVTSQLVGNSTVNNSS